MMRLYQWFVTVALLLGLSPALSVGQQWSGNSNTTDPIGRTGNVGIGTTSPSFRVSIAGGYQTSGLTHPADYLHIGATGASPNAAQIVFGDNTGWKLHVGTRVSGTFTERMTILDTGNVGIGTTGPAKKLDVIGDLFVGNGAVGRIYLGDQSSKNDYIENNDAGGGGYRFVADGLERVRIAIGGNIGIGTTNPAQKLDVAGFARAQSFSSDATNVETTSGNYSPTKMVYRFNEGRGIGYNSADNRVYFAMNEGVPMVIGADGNVGIGTTSPTGKLHVQGTTGLSNYSGIFRLSGGTKNPGIFLSHDETSGQNRIAFTGTTGYWGTLAVGSTDVMSFLSSGNVGIGTTGPGEKLEVNGNVRATTYKTTANDILYAGSTLGQVRFYRPSGTEDIALYAGGAERVRILGSNGNVGIGTTTPDPAYLLSVNGKIRAKEIKVETGWADEVFDEQYPLMPLSELEARIKQQKHLPGIPSAAEVEANGVNLGEMQTKLLQKIEELTLYMIALKKENDALKTRVFSLEQQTTP